MKFDSTSRVQTEIAKAFSVIWDKLTQLEEENKFLKEENDLLKQENQILKQNSTLNSNEYTPSRNNPSNPKLNSNPRNVWTEETETNRFYPQSNEKSHSESRNQDIHHRGANVYHDRNLERNLERFQDRYQQDERDDPYRDNYRSRSPIRSEEKFIYARQGSEENIQIGNLSPRKIIDNDRKVRVKMLQNLTPDQRKRNYEEDFYEDEVISEDVSSPRRISSFKTRMNSEPIVSPRSRGSQVKTEYPGVRPGATTDDDLPVVKRIIVYRNGDTHHTGEELTLNMKRFANFNQVIQLLNEKMYMGTPIRKLYQVPEHKSISTLEGLFDGQILLAVGGEMKIKGGSRYPLKLKLLRETYLQNNRDD